MYVKLLSVIVTLVISALIGGVSIHGIGEYGWTVFVVVPIIIGFLPPYLVGMVQEIGKFESFKLSFLTLVFALIGLLLFAIEGLICIAMASPLLVVAILIASYFGYKVNKGKWINPTNSSIGLIVLCVTSMGFDVISESDNLIPVKTKITVNAPIENVWHNVVTFNKIDTPNDWIFKTGIAYPTDATIKGTGVGAVRYCNFTTGSFVEPITTWNEPNLLQFDVIEQPIPMNEFNPFWDIHPPHLDGYFLSRKGQFKLTKLANGSTELEGTTWYKLDILPQQYWKQWSDFVIHRIHQRVLNHIKKEAEGEFSSEVSVSLSRHDSFNLCDIKPK